jgi:arylsulfatase A-like enzyme
VTGGGAAETSPLGRAGEILLLAASIGLATGIVHAAIVVAQRLVFHEFSWLSRDVLWMSPVAHVLLLVAVAVPLAVVALLTPHAAPPRIATFAFLALGAFSLLLTVPRIYPIALLLIAIGVAVRLSGSVRRLAHERRRRVGALAMGMAAFVLLEAGVATARHVHRDGEPGTAAPADAPNVLLIILDTVRAASTSLNGYTRQTTPELDRLAAEGVVFDWAFAPASWTLPSHASIFTGEYAEVLSTDWRRPLDGAYRTLAEVLRDRGYRTAGFVANLPYTSDESGLARGFDHYEDHRVTLRQTLLSMPLTQTRIARALFQGRSLGELARAVGRFDLRPYAIYVSDRKDAPQVFDRYLAWQHGSARPWFAFLNLYDAHEPYAPPDSLARRFAAEPTPRDRYDAAIAYLDSEIGRVLRVLATQGTLDRTIVIVTSDHGELFGEHGLYAHGVSLYLDEIHVPLLIRYPARVHGGRRVTQAVTLRDLAATILDLAALSPSALPGASLAPLWAVTTPPANASPAIAFLSRGENTPPGEPVSRGPLRSLLSEAHQYIRDAAGAEELYAYPIDPHEESNLVNMEGGGNIAGQYRALLERAMGKPADARPGRSSARQP